MIFFSDGLTKLTIYIHFQFVYIWKQQINHSFQARTWNGTFTVLETGSTQMGQELTVQHKLDTGKLQGKIGQCTLRRSQLVWKRHWYTIEVEHHMALEPTGLCMNTAWLNQCLVLLFHLWRYYITRYSFFLFLFFLSIFINKTKCYNDNLCSIYERLSNLHKSSIWASYSVYPRRQI